MSRSEEDQDAAMRSDDDALETWLADDAWDDDEDELDGYDDIDPQRLAAWRERLGLPPTADQAVSPLARRQRLVKDAVANVLERADDPSASSLPIVLVAPTPADERVLLDGVQRLLTSASAHVREQTVRKTALDVIRGDYGAEGQIVLVDRMPLIPHWGELVEANGRHYIGTATTDEWSSIVRVPEPGSVGNALATALVDSDESAAQSLAEDYQPRHIAQADLGPLMLASLGLALPQATLERLSSPQAFQSLLDAGVFRESRLNAQGDEHLLQPVPTSLDYMLSFFDNDRLRRVRANLLAQAIQGIVEQTWPADGPVVLALLRKLALHVGFRSSVRMVLDRAARDENAKLRQLWANSPLSTRLAWAKLIGGFTREVSPNDTERMIDFALAPLGAGAGDDEVPAPLHVFVAHLRAVLTARNNRNQTEALGKAVDKLDVLTRQHPRNAYAWQALASMQRRLGRREDALHALAEAEWYSPGNPYVLVESALIRTMPSLREPGGPLDNGLPKKEDYDTAEQALCLALLDAPDNGVVLNAWARQLRRRASYADADGLLARAISLEPWNVYHRVERATLLKDAGRLSEAEDEARRARDLTPDNPYALITLADILVERARHQRDVDGRRDAVWEALLDEAEQLLERAEQGGEALRALVARSVLAAERDEWNEASASLDRANNLDLDNLFVAATRANLELQFKHAEQANTALGTVEDEDPQRPLDEEAVAVLVTLRARIDAARGRPALSVVISTLEDWRRRLPPFPNLSTALIDVYLQDGGTAALDRADALCRDCEERFQGSVYVQRARRLIDEAQAKNG